MWPSLNTDHETFHSCVQGTPTTVWEWDQARKWVVFMKWTDLHKLWQSAAITTSRCVTTIASPLKRDHVLIWHVCKITHNHQSDWHSNDMCIIWQVTLHSNKNLLLLTWPTFCCFHMDKQTIQRGWGTAYQRKKYTDRLLSRSHHARPSSPVFRCDCVSTTQPSCYHPR